MKKALRTAVAALLVAGTAGTALAAGTDNAAVGANRKRVGILAYCADMYHNAGDTGLQSNKANIQFGSVKQGLANLGSGNALGVTGNGPQNFLVVNGRSPESFLPNLFQDGPFGNLGQYGAQNLADYLAYDDGIDRVRDIEVIDGDLVQPTATQLIQNFDIVIAYTDNKCGEPIPGSIANQAANALAGYVASPGKKLILTGFAFSSTLGFGAGIFGPGQSPLTKGGPGNAACTRDAPCAVGLCPAPCAMVPTAKGPECQDGASQQCTLYQPVVGGVLGTNNAADQACREFLNNVGGPTSSSWATALTRANVRPNASLCINYDSPTANVPYIAINAARNIVAINAFPPDATDIQKSWFGCQFGDVIQYLSGDLNRCDGRGIFCY